MSQGLIPTILDKLKGGLQFIGRTMGDPETVAAILEVAVGVIVAVGIIWWIRRRRAEDRKNG